MGEETCGGFAPHLSCKRDQIKMRDYMDRRVTPPKRVTSPTCMRGHRGFLLEVQSHAEMFSPLAANPT